MEVCGSIHTNGDYTEFHLKCIYCSLKSNLIDWRNFVLHIRNAHSFDAELPDNIGNNTEELNSSVVVKEPEQEVIYDNGDSDMWSQCEMDVYENNQGSDSDNIAQLEEFSNINNQAGALKSEGESQSIVDEIEYLEDSKSVEMSDDDESYGDFSDPSEEETEKLPAKFTKNNSIQLKLEVDFNLYNPRILQFIEEIKKHPCIWNPSNSNFHDENAEIEAFNSIMEAMDKKVNVLLTTGELKKSIGQLLDQYMIAAEKANEKKLSDVALRYYNRCRFLACTPSSCNIESDEIRSDLIQLDFKKINEMTTVFIDVYGNFPVLYSSSNPDFKCIDARTRAYIEMAELLEPVVRVNDTEVHLTVMRLRKWVDMALRRVKTTKLNRPLSKPELHYLQMCSFLPPKAESFVINCNYCDKRFCIDYSLRTHMVKVHNVGELPYQCSQCPRRFEKSHDMDRHKLRTHCEKLLKCDYCDGKFSLNTDLRVHMRIHTGEKPFVCEICGQSFRLKLQLDYHINGRHLDLRPYACDLCPKKYTKQVQLKNHLKSHLNIKDKKCEECGARFSCPTSLCRHRKTHQKPQSQL